MIFSRTKNSALKYVLPLAVVSLSACGAASTPDSGEEPGPTDGGYVAFNDTSSTERSALTYVEITNGGAGSDGNAGTLDHDMRTIASGSLAGTISADFTTIALQSGGTANLSNPDATAYLRIFTTEGTAANRFGVVGQATVAADIPDTGSSTYSGSVNMQAADGSTDYNLNGDATITARWGMGRGVDTSFTNLSGTSAGGSPVTNVGTLRVDNGVLGSDSRFVGGDASGTGIFAALSGSENLSGTTGYFFGPMAGEVGGTVVVDDTANGSLNINGVYSGK